MASWMGKWTFVVVAVSVTMASIAHAQQAPVGAPAEATGADQEGRVCPLQESYDRAFELFADGAHGEAEALLVEVLAACPDYRGAEDLLRHVRERRARPWVALGDPSAVPEPPAAAASPVAPAYETWERPSPSRASVPMDDGEEDSDLARVELSIAEGLLGVFHGAWFCAWADIGCDEKGGIGLGFAGAALFAGTSAALTWNGMTMGQGTAIETGTFFGTWLGMATWFAAGAPSESSGSSDHLVPLFTVLLSGLAGTAAGGALAVTAVPDSGRVALAASGGLWGGVLGLMISLIPQASDYSVETLGASQLIGVPVGMIAGIVGGMAHRTSRGRMLLVDLGTLLGGALSIAGAVLTSDGGSDFGQHLGAWSAALLPIGFGVTMWLTASLDVPDEVAEQVSIVPAGPGDGPGLTLGVKF